MGSKEKPGRRMLGRILQAVAITCPEVGYCQGMNFVAVALLLGRLPEEVTGGPVDRDEDEEQEQRLKRKQEKEKQEKLELERQRKRLEAAKGVEEKGEAHGVGEQLTISTSTSTKLESIEESVPEVLVPLTEEEREEAEFDCYRLIVRLVHKQGKFGMQVCLSLSISLGFKGLFLYTGGVSCVMWSCTLDSSDVLQSYPITSPS